MHPLQKLLYIQILNPVVTVQGIFCTQHIHYFKTLCVRMHEVGYGRKCSIDSNQAALAWRKTTFAALRREAPSFECRSTYELAEHFVADKTPFLQHHLLISSKCNAPNWAVSDEEIWGSEGVTPCTLNSVRDEGKLSAPRTGCYIPVGINMGTLCMWE